MEGQVDQAKTNTANAADDGDGELESVPHWRAAMSLGGAEPAWLEREGLRNWMDILNIFHKSH